MKKTVYTLVGAVILSLATWTQTKVFVGSPQPQVKATTTSTVAIPRDTTVSYIPLDTEAFDTDSMHFTSGANLTGTVTKTASSTTLAGSSTLFSSELSVGQVILVPGTANERRVVTAIASNTSLTVNTAFANTASGQTATRQNSCIVIRVPGTYLVTGWVDYAVRNSGVRLVFLGVNTNTQSDVTSSTTAGQFTGPTAGAYGSSAFAVGLFQFNQWDFVDLMSQQGGDAGGDLNTGTGSNLQAIRVSP